MCNHVIKDRKGKKNPLQFKIKDVLHSTCLRQMSAFAAVSPLRSPLLLLFSSLEGNTKGLASFSLMRTNYILKIFRRHNAPSSNQPGIPQVICFKNDL